MKGALTVSDKDFESYEPDLITLLDEEDNEYEFSILKSIDYKDSTFYALMPLFELPDEDMDPESTYMIFEAVEDEDGNPQLAEIEDEELIDELAEIFEDYFNSEYDSGAELNDEEDDEDE